MRMKKSKRNNLMKKYIDLISDKDNFLSISDKDFYWLCKKNFDNNNKSYCRHLLDKRLKNKLSKPSCIYLEKRLKNDKILYDKCGEYIIRHLLNIKYMIYGRNTRLGYMKDVDKHKLFNGEYVWTFVVPYEAYQIYIKIKFIKNTIKVLSFHENEIIYKYQYIFLHLIK